MSDYDRSANARFGAGVARSGAGAIDQGLRAYMLGVYNYMTLGLGVTGLVAYLAFVASVQDPSASHLVLTAFGYAINRSILGMVVIFAPLAIVMWLSAARNTMSVNAARIGFLLISASIGLSMSTVFLIYTHMSIARVFFMTAASFAGLSLYGYTTRRSLTAIGSFMMMGLYGLVFASLGALVLSMFGVPTTGLQWGLSVVSVVIFAGLTAWNTQAIKDAYYAGASYEAQEKTSIFGALQLYLDFINMFQSLLYLFGDRRN